MRNAIKSGLLALACLGFSAGSARAAEVVVKVPFPFVVGSRTLPAGEYVVERLTGDLSLLLIRSTKGHAGATAVVWVDPASGEDPAGNQPSLTFRLRENQYWLSAIWESRTQGQDVLGA